MQYACCKVRCLYDLVVCSNGMNLIESGVLKCIAVSHSHRLDDIVDLYGQCKTRGVKTKRDVSKC